MSSSVEQLFAAHSIPVIVQHFGESAVVSVPNATPYTVTLCATLEDTEAAEPPDGKVNRRIRFAMLQKPDELPMRATVTLGGIEYAVEMETERNATYTTYKLIRIERTEIARHGYRRP